MEYEGMTAEVVWSGIKAGSNGSTTTSSTGTGAGAAAGADFFFFLVAFFLVPEAAAMPTQMHRMASKRTHATIGMKDPAEPEAVEPELAWEPDESPEVKDLMEAEETKELMEAEEVMEAEEPEVKESKEPKEPDEESHGVNVVVGVSVGTAGAGVVVTPASLGFLGPFVGSAVIVPTTAPVTMAAAAAAVPTPTPISSGRVNPAAA